MAEESQDTPNTPADGTRQVALQRIYCRDASLESPLTPQVFNRQWAPKVDVQVGTNIDGLGGNIYQVTLSITVTAKLEEDTAYLVEVHQAGIFQLIGFTDQAEVQSILGAYCPNVVFPFARETICDLVQRGGFPQLLLQPINFEALYMQHLEHSRAEAERGATVN